MQNDQAHRLAQPLCQRFLIWQVSRYLQGHEQRGVVLIKQKRQKNDNKTKKTNRKNKTSQTPLKVPIRKSIE